MSDNVRTPIETGAPKGRIFADVRIIFTPAQDEEEARLFVDDWRKGIERLGVPAGVLSTAILQVSRADVRPLAPRERVGLGIDGPPSDAVDSRLAGVDVDAAIADRADVDADREGV